MEADAIGIRLMARACYNPHAAISMLQKLHGLEVQQARSMGGQVPSILRTHPLSEERVAAARRSLPEAMRLLEGTDCSVGGFQFLQGLASAFK
jgi:metalloendopeptidase OMA1, mitochondrial